MKRQPWVIKENKAGNGLESPSFFIDYDRKRPAAENRAVSYQILSLLKQDADLVIKLDSSLLNLPLKQREGMILDLIEELKLKGLEYRYRRYLGPPSPNLWNQLLPFRKEEYRHEVIIYLPDQVWRQQNSLDSALMRALGYGTYYYVCKPSHQGPEIVDAYFNGQISPRNQNEFFTLGVFDWTDFCQMGLFAGSLSLTDLKMLLKME
jgi:hypothetical protein